MFILLCGEDYYPARWDDYVGKFETIDGARSALPNSGWDDWYQIVDMDSMSVVEEGDLVDGKWVAQGI